jgi:gluconolactonase
MTRRARSFLCTAMILTVSSCGPPQTPKPVQDQPVHRIEKFDNRLERLIPSGAEIEILADGFNWSEGPVWVADGGFLLFSDVPENKIFKWSPEDGLSDWLQPSGYTGTEERSGGMGSNGLVIDAAGKLVMAQHGDRRIARLDAPLDAPAPQFVTIVDRWSGMRLNSPNDLVYDRAGNLYFTDPPYGLPNQDKDVTKEIPFSGVFRLGTSGELSLIDDMIRRPNGAALSPDESTLYVTDAATGTIVAFDLSEEGKPSNRRLFADMSSHEGDNGADGIKVDVDGNIYSTGPLCVHVFAPDGRELGAIRTGGRCSNLAWGDDGSSLYITADMNLIRVKTTTSGL